MSENSRRQFLKNAGLLASGLGIEHLAGGSLASLVMAAQRSFASAQVDPSARFVMIRVHGAMDSTQGLHPYLLSNASGFAPEDLYLGYAGKDQPLANILNTQISLGPSAAKIAPFAREMAIVRGVIVGPNDFGHPFAIQHMTSGRTQETAPGWTSYLGSDFASKDDSYVVTNAPLYRGTLKKFPMHLTSILRTQVTNMQQAGTNSPLSVYSGNEDLGASHYLKLLNSKSKIDKFIEVINSNKHFDQAAYDGAIAQGLTPDQAQQAAIAGDASDETIVAAALYSGVARVGQIDIQIDDGGNLDTHASHKTVDAAGVRTGHMPAQAARWNRIADFLTLLKKLELFDKTVVIVITEFNRTPGLNGNGGKDHNYPDNAVAIFGRGVNGGTVVGDHKLYTRADGFPIGYWAGDHIDFKSGETVTGKAKKGSSLIHPADVWASVINSLDPDLIASLPTGARVIPKLFKA